MTGDVPNLPDFIRNEASSIKIDCKSGWVVFYESVNYGDDELWVECPVTAAQESNLAKLHDLRRPHPNHWGDEIASVAFAESLAGSSRTILYANGRVVIE